MPNVSPEIWAIRRSAFQAIQAELVRHDPQAIRAPAALSGPAARQAGAVAVLPMMGPISQRADLWSMLFGGTSTECFGAMFAQAVADPNVAAIVINVDSPGGTVSGVPELAAQINAARGTKPIVAVANGMAASAAYWLASQADEIVVTPSGEVGSIGVFCAHFDESGALEQAGVKPTLISAGKYKVEGNPFGPLTDEALASIQSRVDDLYAMFTSDVAKARAMPVDRVRGRAFGEGRMLGAKRSVNSGMADRVGTLSETIGRLSTPQGRRTVRTAGSTEWRRARLEARFEPSEDLVRRIVRAERLGTI